MVLMAKGGPRMSVAQQKSAIDEEAMRWLTPGSPGRDPLRRDPFGFYERLREHDPVYEAPDGRWLLTGHAESLAFLQNRKGHTHLSGIPVERMRWEPVENARVLRMDGVSTNARGGTE